MLLWLSHCLYGSLEVGLEGASRAGKISMAASHLYNTSLLDFSDWCLQYMCRHIRWEDSLLSKEESREQEEFVFFQADMPFCTKVFLWVCPHACVTSQASFVLCFFSTAKDKSWMRLRCESFFFFGVFLTRTIIRSCPSCRLDYSTRTHVSTITPGFLRSANSVVNMWGFVVTLSRICQFACVQLFCAS